MASKVDGGKGSKAPKGAEKRRMKRIKTSRQVLFSNFDATGLLRKGIAEDMSAGGLRIATHYPESAGVEIQIELQPKPGDNEGEVVLLRGRVTHVIPLEDGNSAMGVHLLDGPGFSGGGSSRRSGGLSPMRKAYFRPRAGRLARHRSAPHDWLNGSPRSPRIRRIRMTAHDHEVGAQVRSGGSARRARRWAIVLSLLFLFALLFSGPPADSLEGRHRMHGTYTPAAQAAAKKRETRPEPEALGRNYGSSSSEEAMEGTAPMAWWDLEDGLDASTGVTEATSNAGRLSDDAYASIGVMEGTTPMAWGLEDGLDASIGVMEATLSAGGLLDDAEIFARPAANLGVPAIERFLALLERAEVAAARGEKGHALAMLRKGLALAGDIPEPLHVEGRQLMARLARPGWVSGMGAAGGRAADGRAADGRAADGRAADGRAADGWAADGWAADGLGIDIDTTQYVLSILRKGRVLLSFPVGLGQDGSTPLGTFRIANKITDPAWYNRGTVVPAGAPDNPLGRRWIGLGAGGRATRYGIHPTSEPQSIGKASSRGCVRMRPDDADTVFRLCPIGTPVRIHS